MLPALLACVVLAGAPGPAAAAPAQHPPAVVPLQLSGSRGMASDCARRCTLHVRPDQRRQACGVCIRADAREPNPWVLELARQQPYPAGDVDALSRDGDWRIRWAAVRAMSRQDNAVELTRLATWVRQAPPDQAVACAVTAAHVLGARGRTSRDLARLGRDGPAAAARVWALREQVRTAMELELFAGPVESRAETLGELGVFLGQPPARVAVNALATRTVDADPELALALRSWAASHHQPLGQVLLAAARPADQARVDRLLAVYAREIDALRQGLTARDPAAQRAVALELRNYLPLSERELDGALLSSDASVSLAAAHALAGPEEGAVVRYVESQVPAWASGKVPSPELAARWVLLASRTAGGRCLPRLAPLAAPQVAPALRAAAVPGLMACGGKTGLGALEDRVPEVRLAAVTAVAEGGWTPTTLGSLLHAAADPDPRVVVAAVRGIAGRGGEGAVPLFLRLVDHPDAGVRVAAVEALGQRNASASVQSLARRLGSDSAAPVRVAAAVALGQLGGPVAVAALAEAAHADADSHVQYVAKDSLRRLGFQK